MNQLVWAEKDFGTNVLDSVEARVFYRRWRKIASSRVGTWKAIRESTFIVAGKERFGRDVISALRKHLATLQNERCCYCQRSLDGIAYAQPIEHILPRKTYKQYTFIYRNLAVACYNCNKIKRDSNWSTWPSVRKHYPPERNCRGFFHARFHIYDSHIRRLNLETNGASINVYSGLTPQGQHLCRTLLSKSSKKTLEVTANKRFSAAMDKLHNQAQQMLAAQNDATLLDFIEALDLSATST